MLCCFLSRYIVLRDVQQPMGVMFQMQHMKETTLWFLFHILDFFGTKNKRKQIENEQKIKQYPIKKQGFQTKLLSSLISSFTKLLNMLCKKCWFVCFLQLKKMLFWFRFVVVLFIYALLGVQFLMKKQNSEIGISTVEMMQGQKYN